ncbi:MAG: tetratricopeptide repeat protein [Planctomycetota bacterium]
MTRLDAKTFLEAVAPALEAGDAEALSRTVRERWAPSQLCGLLSHADADVRRTAVVVLGIIGAGCEVGCLTRCLRDDDEQVHRFAEDALWSIWFRGGKPDAAARFRAGVLAMTDDNFRGAVKHFDAALALDPEFAEAFNQLAIAHYLQGEWEASLIACRQALALMPTHFGAMAGLGHCYAHLGRLRAAIDCYRRALTINPRMEPIAHAKERLEARLGEEGEPPLADDDPTETLLLRFESEPLYRD